MGISYNKDSERASNVMFVVSLNYKNTATEFRESFAFDEDKTKLFLNCIKEEGISECVYVKTCNRCEVYGVGKASKLIPVLAKFADVEVETLKENLLFFDGNKAVDHLFHVISGFESMVLGEDEILRQMKEAYAYSMEAGFTGYEINTTFQSAIACAKRIKTETRLSKSSVSIASLAATKIHNFKRDINVMIIGATGDTGHKVMKNLLSYGNCNIYVTKHIHQVNAKNVITIPYEDRYKYINQMDVIVSATKSPHYTITYGKVMSQELEKKDRLFVDLAVPRDIDEDITKLQNSGLITIDDFENIAKENNAIKLQEKENGEIIIEEEINDLLKDLIYHDNRNKLKLIKDFQQDDFQHFIFKYKEIATAEEFSSFVSVITQMTGA